MNWQLGERSFKTKIPVVGATSGMGEGEPYTHIELYVAWSDRKHFYVMVHAVRVDRGFTSHLLFGGASKTVVVERCSRYNAKKLIEWQQTVGADVENGDGMFSVMVQAIADEIGGELASWQTVAA